jgi:hypothetical protein
VITGPGRAIGAAMASIRSFVAAGDAVACAASP